MFDNCMQLSHDQAKGGKKRGTAIDRLHGDGLVRRRTGWLDTGIESSVLNVQTKPDIKRAIVRDWKSICLRCMLPKVHATKEYSPEKSTKHLVLCHLVLCHRAQTGQMRFVICKECIYIVRNHVTKHPNTRYQALEHTCCQAPESMLGVYSEIEKNLRPSQEGRTIEN